MLRDMRHVEIIRIGMRTHVVLPVGIPDGLLNMLKKYHPVCINTHFNRPIVFTLQSIAACEEIVNAWVSFGNQTVLLKGISDNVEAMKELLLKLVKARVRPYHLYQCGLALGIGHLRMPAKTGIEIMKNIKGVISSYAIPTCVIDAPGSGGKIPINPEYVISMTMKRWS